MKKNTSLSQDDLKRCLSYDPLTGEFVWLVSSGRVVAGARAGYVERSGYLHIGFGGIKFPAHRLAWFYIYGTWPDEIDHCDRDKMNNRISNLRLCTHSQNAANRTVRSDSKIGLKGVSRLKSGYRSEIRKHDQRWHLGVFKTAEEAHSAYMEASRRLHGEFVSC